MSIERTNFNIDQGSDFRFEVTLLDVSGDPIDLSGSFIFGDIRKTASSLNVEASFVVDPIDLVSGQFALKLPAAVSSTLACLPSYSAERTISQFAYDVEIHFPSGAIKRVLSGTISLSPEVTR